MDTRSRSLMKKAKRFTLFKALRKLHDQFHAQAGTHHNNTRSNSTSTAVSPNNTPVPSSHSSTSNPSHTILTPITPFPFSSLPTELRHQILGHVLTTSLTPPNIHYAISDTYWRPFKESDQEMLVAYILADGACSYDFPVLFLNKKMPYACPYLPLLLTSRGMREDVGVVARRVERGMGPVIDVQVEDCETLYASWLRMPFLEGGEDPGNTNVGAKGVVIENLTIMLRFCKSSTMTYKLDQTELILRKLIRRVIREGPSPYLCALNGGSARVKRLVIELQTTPNAARYKSVSRRVPLARTLHLAWSEPGRGGERDLGDVDQIAIRVDGMDFYTVKYRG